MLEQVRTDLKSKLPDDLVDALLNSYQEIKHNYIMGKHEPAELNGGKFCEVIVRIIQFETHQGNLLLWALIFQT